MLTCASSLESVNCQAKRKMALMRTPLNSCISAQSCTKCLTPGGAWLAKLFCDTRFWQRLCSGSCSKLNELSRYIRSVVIMTKLSLNVSDYNEMRSKWQHHLWVTETVIITKEYSWILFWLCSELKELVQHYGDLFLVPLEKELSLEPAIYNYSAWHRQETT